MPEEARVLAECSAAAGEAPETIAARPEAGWALVHDRLGLARAEIEQGVAPGPVGELIDAIEAEARAQAARVWARW
jgi:hypothetical protein